jgi:DNA polymerase (family 10)
MGFKLNEYGLFSGDSQVAGAEEQGVYHALGLAWIPPELRENRGEIAAAEEGTLPALVEVDDIRGDLQMHTTWSDGSTSLEEMVETARSLGHEYIAITDHGGTLRVAGSMDAETIRRQGREIARLQERYDDIRILHGVEANILKDGSVDVAKEVLRDLDVVLASVHSAFRMDRNDMTRRVVAAIQHPYVDILAHPTCRVIQRREPVDVDMETVLDAAREAGVVMEINAFPERLDLNDVHVKMAVEHGVHLSVGTDAHAPGHLRHYVLGVAVARRGWAEKRHVVNTYDVRKLADLFAK